MNKDKPLVSIDIFDTAVFRNVYYPRDVFKVIENNGNSGFYKARIEAQGRVAKRPSATIVDIYKELPSKFKMKDEILAEIQGTYANPEILDFYNKNRDKYDIIFISDMYLTSDILKLLLEHAGYKDPVVFVSCEEGCSKGSGNLFLKVQEKLGRSISKHIGDNYKVDIDGAKRAQIPEVEFVGPAIYDKEVVTPTLREPRLRKLLIDNELNKRMSVEEKIGFMFAPLVLAFTQYLLDKVPENKTIFFNARDSFLMYVTARWILKTKKKIKYCRFSRKSIHLSGLNRNFGLWHEQNERHADFFLGARTETLRDFLISFDITSCTSDYTKVLEHYKLTLDTKISFNAARRQILKDFVNAIEKDIFEKSAQEQTNLREYLRRLDMSTGDFFVDLGHAGSMQNGLQKVSGLDLNGEYLHLFKNYQELYPDGYKRNSFLPFDFLKGFTGIAELVFTEPTGTVIGYSKKGIPILKGCSKYRRDIIKTLLRSTLKGVKILLKTGVNVYKEDCEAIFKRIMEHPTLEEAEFANKDIFENGSISTFNSVSWYNKDMIKKGKLKDCYCKSFWKAAFKVLIENDPEYKSLAKGLF